MTTATIREVAALYGIPARTLYRWIRQGLLPITQQRPVVKVRLNDVDQVRAKRARETLAKHLISWHD